MVEAVSSTFELDDAETPWLGSDKVTSSRAPGKSSKYLLATGDQEGSLALSEYQQQ